MFTRSCIYLRGVVLALSLFQGLLQSQCVQNCFNWYQFCVTTKGSQCQTYLCYKYYGLDKDGNKTKDHAYTCYECGGPGKGWCKSGDANQTC